MLNALDPLAALSGHLAELAAMAAARTVTVHGRDGRTVSGILWDEGLIVTAEEPLERDDELGVTLPDGARVTATLAGRDPGTDVALLRAPTGAVTAMAVAPAAALSPGHLVLATGRVAEGPIAGLGMVALIGGPWRSLRGGKLERRIRLAIKAAPEVEGGPVLDHAGRLVGMAVAGPRRQVLAIPAETIERVVGLLCTHGRIARGYLGLATQPIAQGATRGLIVVGVDAEGPAGRAGILLGDVVAAIDGVTVCSVREMLARLDPETVGRDVPVDLIRAGARQRLTVRIGERPSL